MPKPYQQPHPPIAVAGMSPYPFFVKEAAARLDGDQRQLHPAASVAPLAAVQRGLRRGRRRARRRALARRARTVLVTETDAEAAAYLARPRARSATTSTTSAR